ncbi:hypothetical protein EYF80_050313 [Liparis tanakae]|uniref:Uncharacterized protein n=1 Tax=Liparis tanakae TaxID=230148 RepID=A0A4Z2FFJ9_9TELE|nr:hypothetical protein EYF80_050313 [Liparis tanakae]
MQSTSHQRPQHSSKQGRRPQLMSKQCIFLGQVDFRNQAVVTRSVSRENNRESSESIGNNAGTEQEEDDLLETSPLAQKSDGVFVILHGLRAQTVHRVEDIVLYLRLTLRHQLNEKQGHCFKQKTAADGQPSWKVSQNQPAGNVRRHLHRSRDEAAHVRVGVELRRVERQAVVAVTATHHQRGRKARHGSDRASSRDVQSLRKIEREGHAHMYPPSTKAATKLEICPKPLMKRRTVNMTQEVEKT